MSNKKAVRKERRKKRVRSKLFGSKKVPRLSVFRSAKHIYAQAIDDKSGKTLFSVSDIETGRKKENKRTKTEIAKEVGLLFAQKAEERKIKKVIFDRNGYKYHGRIKALAEGARKGGLNF